jgi:hypothetical protein
VGEPVEGIEFGLLAWLLLTLVGFTAFVLEVGVGLTEADSVGEGDADLVKVGKSLFFRFNLPETTAKKTKTTTRPKTKEIVLFRPSI